MTAKDVDGLFQLLEIYFPNSPKVKSKTLKSAWLLVLEPFPPEAVKRALAEQLRESRFFPDPQAVAVRCKLPPRTEQPAHTDSTQGDYSKELNAMMTRLGPWYEAYKKALHDHGLPTAVEAKLSGISVLDWREMVKGVEVPHPWSDHETALQEA